MTDIKFIGTTQVELVNSLDESNKISPTQVGENFIEFSFNSLSKDNKDYYHFVITGSNIEVSGTIDSVTTKHQYVNLFKDCYQITDASQLQFNGNIMRQFCYSNMFLNCTGLVTPPTTLSAQNLDAWCYAGMFAGCENMTTAPSLPAKTLAKYCYYAMFYNCKSLSSTINLPAPDLKEFCYDSMFWGCQNITNITIHGADLFDGSCANMFVKCSNLSALHLFAGNWDTVANTSAHCNATNMWCYDVPTTLISDNCRKFYCIQQLPFTRGYNYIPNNWQILYSSPMLFKSTGSTTVSFDKVGNPYQSKFRYSVNWGPVSTYTLGQPIQLSDGDELTFRGDRTLLSKDSSNYYRFATSGDGKLILSGWLQAMNRHTKPTSGTYRNMFEFCTNITNANKLSGFEYVADTSHVAMFRGCTSLTAAPQLPATEVYTSTYASMFSGCTALRIPPVLPATGLANYSYYRMFEGCSSLVTPPALPASTLATQCYYRMFANCSNLTGAPVLSATTLAPSCYYSMFNSCYKLVNASSLPATNLTNYCYAYMFSNCSSLITAPALSATTLADNCYQSMFYGCSSLINAPKLPATTVATSAYAYMFNRCSKLNTLDVNFSTWSSSGEVGNDTYGWVYGVASKGDFYKPDGLSTVYGTNRIPTGWRPQHKYLTFTSKSANAYINLEKVGSPNDITLKYRKNSGSWTNYTIGNSISLTSGQTVSFSGANDHFSLDGSNRYTFKLTGNVEADGNIQSLMNYSNTLTENCYRSLFLNCSGLLTPPTLPATGLANGCYRGMFDKCSKLSTAPYLPATTLAPSCYLAMFEDCTALVSVQTTLPATILAAGCYMGMFNFCSKLSTAPTLPATTCVPSCYSHMFKDCTALTGAPALPATTLARSCYSSMFRDCKNIKVAPRISNAFPYQASYYVMFAGCSKLSSIEVDFDSWDLYDYQNATYGWVSGVASTGTFKKPTALTTTRGVNYIPSNWSVVNK